MRAFAIDRYKGSLQERAVAEPDVGPHDVLVRVEAAGLNALDEKIRLGDPVMIITSGRSARVTRALPPVPESAATPASGATSGPRP